MLIWLMVKGESFATDQAEVLIVGGSLSGIALALACAERGIHTRVFERSRSGRRSGAALGIDRALLFKAVGMDHHDEHAIAYFPPLTPIRNATSWNAIYGWLREQAEQRSEIILTDGVHVSEVQQTSDVAQIVTSTGERIEAHSIIGADGYRSVVRQVVAPDRPHAKYAGYLLWRGLVEESHLPPTVGLPENDDGVALVTETGFRLIAYPVAGADGSTKAGERSISFAWYDRTRSRFLEDLGCISPASEVLSSVKSEQIPPSILKQLHDLASTFWPDPWKSAVRNALESATVFATPVGEYYPNRLQRGRVAIIGDAAHVASPVTGMGFVAGILDAIALADSLQRAFGRDRPDIPTALRQYESSRLSEARKLVAASIEWSMAYVRGERSLCSEKS